MAKVFKEILKQLALFGKIIQERNNYRTEVSSFTDINLDNGLILSVNYGGEIFNATYDFEDQNWIKTKYITIHPSLSTKIFRSVVIEYDDTFDRCVGSWQWECGKHKRFAPADLQDYAGVTLALNYRDIREFSEKLKLVNISLL